MSCALATTPLILFNSLNSNKPIMRGGGLASQTMPYIVYYGFPSHYCL